MKNRNDRKRIRNRNNIGAKSHRFKKKALAIEISAMLFGSFSVSPALAQDGTNGVSSLEEIVVKGIRGGLISSLAAKRDSDQFVDAIIAEDIGKFPDTNVAEALQRVAEVSIDRDGGEGRSVTIRGLGPEFNSVLLNGRRLASSDGSRQFSFDTIAAELVRAATVHKTQAARLKEGGIGGSVNIQTARPIDLGGQHIRGSIKALHEDNSGETTPQGSFLYSKANEYETFGALFAVTYQERENRTYQAKNGLIRTRNVYGYRNLGYDGTTFPQAYRPMELDRDVVNQTRDRLGINAALQFRPSDEMEINIDYLYSKFEVKTENNAISNWFWNPNPPESDAAAISAFNAGAGSAASGGGTITDPNNGSVTQLTQVFGASAFNQNIMSRPTETQMLGFNLDYQLRDNVRFNFDAAYSTAETENKGDDIRLSWETRDLYDFAGDPTQDIDYVIDFTTEVPNLVGVPTIIGAGAVSGDGSNIRIRRNYFEGNDIEADNLDLRGDFEIEVNDRLVINTGISYDVQEKSNNRYLTPNAVQNLYQQAGGNFFFTPQEFAQSSNGIQSINPSDFNQNSDVVNDLFVINTEGYLEVINNPATVARVLEHSQTTGRADATALRAAAFAANGGFRAAATGDSWEIEEKITSLYIEGDYDFQLGDMDAHLNAGLRYVKTDVTGVGFSAIISNIFEVPCTDPQATGCLDFSVVPADGPDGLTKDTVKQDYDDILPSVALTLNLNEEMVLRLGASKSITRPALKQLAPQFIPSQQLFGERGPDGRGASSGNPGLKPYSSTNLDASFEWYFDEGSALALSYFKKDIDDFIVTGEEVVLIDVPQFNDFLVTRPVNSENAEVDGFSVSLTQSFENGLGYQLNYTSVSTDSGFDGEDFDPSKVALTGLGDSWNVVGFYEKGKIGARLAYNFRESFLARSNFNAGFFGERKTEPVFTEDYGQLDARISYNVNDELTVFVEGVNLTEEKIRQHGRFSNLFVSFKNFGRRFTLGASYRF